MMKEDSTILNAKNLLYHMYSTSCGAVEHCGLHIHHTSGVLIPLVDGLVPTVLW